MYCVLPCMSLCACAGGKRDMMIVSWYVSVESVFVVSFNTSLL